MYHRIIYMFAVFFAANIIITGCTNSTESKFEHGHEWLVRVGSSTITAHDFNKAFDCVTTAYTQKALKVPSVLREARLCLLEQMTEELILFERAKELNIEISDADFEKAVTDIKQDYPEGCFEQTLLENVVSYRFWEKQLKNRMLMKKVVTKEIEENIAITPEDITEYYNKHLTGQSLEQDGKKVFHKSELNESIVKSLRREKTEKVYTDWIKKLHQRYSIEINEEQWNNIVDS